MATNLRTKPSPLLCEKAAPSKRGLRNLSPPFKGGCRRQGGPICRIHFKVASVKRGHYALLNRPIFNAENPQTHITDKLFSTDNTSSSSIPCCFSAQKRSLHVAKLASSFKIPHTLSQGFSEFPDESCTSMTLIVAMR
jgi:hypothetical protein